MCICMYKYLVTDEILSSLFECVSHQAEMLKACLSTSHTDIRRAYVRYKSKGGGVIECRANPSPILFGREGGIVRGWKCVYLCVVCV